MDKRNVIIPADIAEIHLILTVMQVKGLHIQHAGSCGPQFQVAEAIDVEAIDNLNWILTDLENGTLDRETALSYLRVLKKILDLSQMLDVDLSAHVVDGELDHSAWFSAVANRMSMATLDRVEELCAGCEDNPLLSDCLAVVKAELRQRTQEGWS